MGTALPIGRAPCPNRAPWAAGSPGCSGRPAADAWGTSPTAQNLFTLPAGAKILRFTVEKTTAISGGSVTAVNTTFGKAGTANAFQTTIDIGLTTAQTARATLDAALVSSATDNIGTDDVVVTGTFTAAGGNPTAGATVVTVEYIQRANNGAQAPTTFQN